MVDLKRYPKRYPTMVESVWFFNMKQFIKGLIQGLKWTLVGIFVLVFIYLFAFIVLTDWEVSNKKVRHCEHQNKTNNVSNNVSEFKKLIRREH